MIAGINVTLTQPNELRSEETEFLVFTTEFGSREKPGILLHLAIGVQLRHCHANPSNLFSRRAIRSRNNSREESAMQFNPPNEPLTLARASCRLGSPHQLCLLPPLPRYINAASRCSHVHQVANGARVGNCSRTPVNSTSGVEL